MTNPTSNFGWQMPQATDLVTNLPADFAVFGQAVDTDFADLNGGTTGQVLSKTSNTDLDFTWAAPTAGDIEGVTAGIGISGGGTSGTVTVTNSMATAIDAKGDLIAGTGADAFSRLAVGTNTYLLTADSAEATGLKWAAPAGGGKVLQVKYFDTTTETTNTTTTNASTTLTGTITPTLNTSKVLVLINQNGTSKATGSGSSAMMLRLFKNASLLVTLGEVLGITSVTQQVNFGGVGFSYLDAPATTSLITYNTEFASFVASVGVTVQQNDSRSTMILMEIGA